MTVDIKMQDDGTVFGWADGAMNFDDLIRELTALWKDPRFGPGTPQIFDLRKLTSVELDVPEIRNVIAEAMAHPHIFQGGCVAIVAPDDSVFGMMRMFEQLADSVPGDVQVFREFDEAQAWMRSFDE